MFLFVCDVDDVFFDFVLGDDVVFCFEYVFNVIIMVKVVSDVLSLFILFFVFFCYEYFVL